MLRRASVISLGEELLDKSLPPNNKIAKLCDTKRIYLNCSSVQNVEFFAPASIHIEFILSICGGKLEFENVLQFQHSTFNLIGPSYV